MNICNIQIQLQTAVNNADADALLDNTSATMYYLELAKAIQALNMGQIRTVSTFASLPSAATSAGWLIFVDADERLYYSNGTNWQGITPVYGNQAWSWGAGTLGVLGDNSTVDKSSPVSVVGGFTNWCQLTTKFRHVIGVRQNGTAWAWGLNSNGQLGDLTVVSKSSPVSVVGGFTDWCQVSVGRFHSLGVRQTGTAWSWGAASYGKLGDNTVTSKSSPVSVVGGFTDWCQVSAGNDHSLGVRQDGTAWAWGLNGSGRLGDNSVTSRRSPVSVVGGFTNWCQVSGGGSHSLGVKQDGTAWGWGSNDIGQLGDCTVVSTSSPVSVVGGFTDWCQVSAGIRDNSLAVRQNGTAWAWGFNTDGQLGDNTITNRSSPVSVVGGFTDWCQVSAGQYHSLAVRQNSTAWSWGKNTYGQLGDNSVTSKRSPVSVVGEFTEWCQVSAGECNSLAITSVAT